jgi:hypothetical protein
MTSLEFTKFPNPGIMYVSEITPNPCFSHVYSKLNDSVYELWIYTYVINPDGISRVGDKVKSLTVLGNATTIFPSINDFSNKMGNRQIPWTYSRSIQGQNVLLLSYLKSKYTEKFFSIFLIDSNINKNELNAIVSSLKKAAGNYGFPLEAKSYRLLVNFSNSTGESSDRGNPTGEPPLKKYFDALGLRPTTNVGLIKAAYRELAKQFHPDSSGNILTERKMKEINVAYEFLLKKYDK